VCELAYSSRKKQFGPGMEKSYPRRGKKRDEGPLWEKFCRKILLLWTLEEDGGKNLGKGAPLVPGMLAAFGDSSNLRVISNNGYKKKKGLTLKKDPHNGF